MNVGNTDLHDGVISFDAGDVVVFGLSSGKTEEFLALDDFHPSVETKYPSDVRFKNNPWSFLSIYGPFVTYDKLMSHKIIRIKKKDGTVNENNLGISQYAFMNAEEFIAELLSMYCMGTLPKKLVTFLDNKLIPVL